MSEISLSHMFLPRGLRREEAARYIGVSPSTFDKLRAEGITPSPRKLRGLNVWDRHDLDAFFAELPVAEPTTPLNPWDD